MRRSRNLVLTTLAFGIGVALLAWRSPSSADDIIQDEAIHAEGTDFEETTLTETEKPVATRNFTLRFRVGPSDTLIDEAFSAVVTFRDQCHIDAGNDEDFELEGDAHAIDSTFVKLTYEARLRSNEGSLRAKGNVLLKVNSSNPTLLQLGDLTLHVWLK